MSLSRSNSLFRSSRPTLMSALLALGSLGAAACQSASKPPQSTSPAPAVSSAPTAPRPTGRVDLSSELTATAVVVAVDPTERMVTLRRDDGAMIAVRAGDDPYVTVAVGASF